MITRAALYCTLALLLWGLGFTVISWQFWAMLGLFWAADHLGRTEGLNLGVIMGIQSYLDMSESEQARIRNLLDQTNGDGQGGGA